MGGQFRGQCPLAFAVFASDGCDAASGRAGSAGSAASDAIVVVRTATMSKYTVLHAPGLETQAQDVASKLEGAVPVLCTTNIMPDSSGALCWDSFPSGDPNIKLRIEAIKDKHVVFLMHHDTRTFFEQVS